MSKKEEEIVLDTLLNDKKPCVVALGGGAFLNKKLQKIILKETKVKTSIDFHRG